jgi:pimeloyl-ACP methyl ester carboxylesterase
LLGGVQTDTLIVWGRQDRIVPVGVGDQFAHALPKNRLSVVDGAGHFLEMEQPEALAKLIVPFAAQA